MRIRAFTLIEVLVATAIVALVATTATIDLVRVRMTGRDGRRKTDVQAFNQAITAYQLATGSSFVIYPGTSSGCTLPSNATALADPTVPSTGSGCVGANGRGYGMLNLTSATTGSSGSDAGRAYGAKSLADALVAGKYLANSARDPLAVGASTDAAQPDYVLVRCCKDGRESIGSTSQNFAIWTHLENAPTQTETDNSNNLCGGSSTATTVGTTYPSLSPYKYDPANGGARFAGALNYAVGTSISPSVSELNLPCFTGKA